MVQMVQFFRYTIYSDGQVWSPKLGFLPGNVVTRGYRQFKLILGDGKKHNMFGHRLVALCFIPNPNNLPEVNHLYGNKLDNRVEMLEWSTSSDNQIHSYRTGLQIANKGSQSGMAKLKESDIAEIFRLRSQGLKQWEIAEMFNVSGGRISIILNGKDWAHTGDYAKSKQK